MLGGVSSPKALASLSPSKISKRRKRMRAVFIVGLIKLFTVYVMYGVPFYRTVMKLSCFVIIR